MKRFCMTNIMVVIIVFCSLQLAQGGVLLSEGFDDVTTLVTNDWYQINHSNPLGLTDWFQGDETLFPAQQVAGDETAYIAANYNNTDGSGVSGGTISNWLITPVLNFAAIDQISFYTRTVDPPIYPDRMEVRLSSSGNSADIGSAETDVGDFDTVLFDINPTLVTDAYPTGYPTEWTQYVITSGELPESGTGRIAFRYFVTDAGEPNGPNAEYIGIDTFEVLSKDFTITPSAGANGAISPSSPVSVGYGGSQQFTFTPDSGYHVADVLVDGNSVGAMPSYTFTNVTEDHTIEVSFSDTYSLTYTAGAHGSIGGDASQLVAPGANGTTVTANPEDHYHFVNWSDGSTANPRTDTNVMANISVTANFAINTFILTYNFGSGGLEISGMTPQTVAYGANGSAVIPVPITHYHFVNWSDGSTANPRTDINVTKNITVTANFAPDTYTLLYAAGANGGISGTTPQLITAGGNGTPVTAVPDAHYHFVNWSDGSPANPRTDTNVTEHLTVTANFAIDTHPLTVTKTGSGSGTVTSDIPGIDCGTDCSEVYDYGTTVMLTATPDPNSAFKGWSGDCTGTETTCIVTVNQAKNVTANFSSFSWNLFLPTILNNGQKQP